MKKATVSKLLEIPLPNGGTTFKLEDAEILYERDDEKNATADDLDGIGWLVSCGDTGGELVDRNYRIAWKLVNKSNDCQG